MANPEYEQNVFINCPFDRSYKRIFDAAVNPVAPCEGRQRLAPWRRTEPSKVSARATRW